MRFRVVCGLEVTMATFCPTSRFTRVDFPAFGRPTIATNPARYPFLCPSPLISVVSGSSGTYRRPGFPILLSSPDVSREKLDACAPAPARSARVHGRAGQLLRFHPQHLPLIGFQHFKPVPLQ